MWLYKLSTRREKAGFAEDISPREYFLILAEWTGISMLASWLLYDELLWSLPLFPGVILWKKLRETSFEEKRRRRYALQYKEGMEVLASAIRAGFSAEASVGEALKNLRLIHGKDNAMMEELRRMTVEMSMNRNLEELFFEMADRSGLEDALSLAEVFRAARRSGGNLADILEKTAELLEEKEAVSGEIEVLLAGKRYEQKIMCMIPFGMIVYLRFGSPGYLDPLYHSAAGICVMTLCLGIYGISVYMGGRVLRIEI